MQEAIFVFRGIFPEPERRLRQIVQKEAEHVCKIPKIVRVS